MFEGKEANVRPWSSLLGGGWSPRVGQLGSSPGEDRSILDSFFSLLSKKNKNKNKWGRLCLPEWSDVHCSVGTRKEERKEGPGREEGSCSASTGPGSRMGKIILWVFGSGLVTGCLRSKARGQRTSLRHQLLLIAFPKAQAGHRGASHKKDPF